MRITVTLARHLGCGGSYLGQRLADALGPRAPFASPVPGHGFAAAAAERGPDGGSLT